MTESLQSMLYRRLDEAPEGRALGWYAPSGETAWATVQELMRRAAGCAARLNDAGLRAGDVCLLVLPSEEGAATLVGSALVAGAVPLLIAPPVLQGVHSTLLQTLQHTIRKTEAPVVVLPSTLAGLAEQLPRRRATRYLHGESLLAGAPEAALPRISPTGMDIAAMPLTSGTTGRPRICVWRQQNFLAGLAGMRTAMALNAHDICFNWTPLYHDMGLVNNFLLCLVHRVPLVMLNPFEFVKHPALWLRGLSATGSTITWSPNFGFALAAQRIRDDELTGVNLSGVRAFWNAAERIHLETLQAFHERFASYGVRFEALKTNYGCAENVGGATFSDPAGVFPVEFVDHELLQRRRTARVIGSGNGGPRKAVATVGVGRGYPGMRVHIVSRSGRPLPDGRVGEIALGTPSQMAGYLQDGAATRRALSIGLLRTGDLGYLRNEELFWVGRVKERITVRGRKLDPSDFEPVLLRVRGLRHGSFATFGIDAVGRGTQQVVIVAEVRDPSDRSTTTITEDIRREVFIHLGVTADEVLLVGPGVLTKTSSGKRRHRHFRRLYLDGRLQSFVIERVQGEGA